LSECIRAVDWVGVGADQVVAAIGSASTPAQCEALKRRAIFVKRELIVHCIQMKKRRNVFLATRVAFLNVYGYK
jgi:hypothetical protein